MDWRCVIAALVFLDGSTWLTAALQPYGTDSLSASEAFAVAASQNVTPSSPRPVAEIPFSRLKPDATIALELERGSVSTDDALWIPQRKSKAIVRVDAKTNKPEAPVTVAGAPCASLAVSTETAPSKNDTVWVPLCESSAIARVSAAQGNVTASVPLPVVTPEGSIATAVGSVWVLSESKGVLTRIDPDTNMPVAEVYVAAKPAAVVAADAALWVTSEAGDMVTRIDPHTNTIVETLKVGPRPGRIVIGEGAVWTLNRGDGSVSRIDPESNKVVTTIAVGAAVANGDIAVGEGSVWISASGMPITRIDPGNNRVLQRFAGPGGGAIIVAHGSVWVAAGPNVTWRIDPKLITAMRP